MLQILLMSIESEDDRVFVEELYSKHQLKLKVIAYSIINEESLAEDCVQDVFLSVIDMLDRFKSFSEEDQIKYLVICIKNSALAKCRDRGKYQSLTEESIDYENRGENDISDEASDVFEIVVNNELKKKLRECIDSLEPQYKHILIMRFQYKMKGKEISQMLHISENLARKRIERAKKKLKEVGGKDLYDLFK
ncbi:MAG: sigma-70 family RNA polymerase sigma factor [Clostridia bacterium]|nr:sigma-70 family RNA polymerase sigma factor [Clostridia bacterium]